MIAEIVIDFLTFTVKGDMEVYQVIESILEMDFATFEHSKGFNFYQKSMVYSDIRILYDGIYGESMGVCVNMSGRGCRAFEEYHNESIIFLLARICKNPDINITRIDIACDDKVGILDLDKMWKYANNGSYRTRLIARNTHESFMGKNEGAKTLYFGSPSSLYRIRIYDKGKQSETYNHWIRFEIVLKAEYASQTAEILVNSECLGEAVAGIINDKFAFVELDDNNISRCSLAGWWSEFLGEIQEVKLTSKQQYNHDIDEHKKWLRNSCGRVIAKVIEAIGEDEFNKEIREYGKLRLTVADVAMIENYRQRINTE